MTVGIIGAGHIGGTLARLLTARGHQVLLSNSRGPGSLAGTVAELGPSARAATVEEAAGLSELAVEAIPFGRYRDLPAAALAGKTLISASNYYPDRDGVVKRADEQPTAVLLAQHLAGTRVVKAFNTIRWQHLRDQGYPSRPLEERRVLPVAADDAAARLVVTELVESLGFGPLDVGTLAQSGVMQPGAPIYDRDVTLGEARRLL